MEAVLRGLAIYIFLLVVFRLSGKRTLAENTNFDLVLLLIISETTQQAMVDSDHSFTHSCLLILTLIGASVLLSHLKMWFPSLDKLLESPPVVVIREGEPLTDRMRKLRIDETDILASGRELQAIERLEQIKYAVVERGGKISIIPK